MPSVLLIKTSSLGDVIHNLPVVSDIRRHFPDAVIDWVVEEAYAGIPAMHPGVRRIIPVAWRRWRRQLLRAATHREIATFRNQLRFDRYDMAIDTQGLLKSAVITRQVRGVRCGYHRQSAREPLAAWLYDYVVEVPKNQHAVERNRQLAARPLGYVPDWPPVYGLVCPAPPDGLAAAPYVVLLHATSRDDKLWPEADWIAVIKRLAERGLQAVLPWGNAVEQARAIGLASVLPTAKVAPRLDMPAAAALLGHAVAVLGVDTGLTHLAAALDRPTVAIFVATDPGLTGVYGGARARNLGRAGQPPDVEQVWASLVELTDDFRPAAVS